MTASARWTAPGLVALTLLTLLACSAKREAPWTGEARFVAEQADALAAQGNPALGALVLERYAQREGPQREEDRLEISVRQDAWAHAAQLQLSAHQAAAAESDATRGLESRETADVYEATLHILRGRARELLGRNPEAASDYDRAAQIDEALLEAAAHGGAR